MYNSLDQFSLNHKNTFSGIKIWKYIIFEKAPQNILEEYRNKVFSKTVRI